MVLTEDAVISILKDLTERDILLLHTYDGMTILGTISLSGMDTEYNIPFSNLRLRSLAYSLGEERGPTESFITYWSFTLFSRLTEIRPVPLQELPIYIWMPMQSLQYRQLLQELSGLVPEESSQEERET